MKHTITTLDNGLRVILVDTEAFPTLTTLLLVGAGSRYENEKNNGVAHFFEHMAFKGSSKYSNSFVIASTIEGLGGNFNAFTSKDHTGYYIKATSEHFPTVVDVISDMIMHPLLETEEINREKGVIIEELNLYEDTPYRKVNELFEGLLYKGNPLGYDIVGTKDTVNSFTRETFVDYIDSLYHPNNAVLIVAGGISQGKNNVMEIIKEKFADWKNGSQKATFVPLKEEQSQPQILLKNKKTEQAHFCLGYRAFSFMDARKYPLTVLATVLGGGMSSKLFIEVRERRGLCYYISSGRELYHDAGNFVTQAGVTNSLEKVKESIKVVIEEHNKIAGGDLKNDDLVKAKALIKGRMLLSMEDSYRVASFYGSKELLEGSTEHTEEVIKKIEEVQAEDVTKLAKDLFKPEHLNFAMIGPFEQGQITVDDLKG